MLLYLLAHSSDKIKALKDLGTLIWIVTVGSNVKIKVVIIPEEKILAVEFGVGFTKKIRVFA